MDTASSSHRARTQRVSIVAPMPNELAPLVRPLGLVRANEGGALRWRGRVHGFEIVAARTGIGMRKAAAITERLIEAEAPDHLVVVGIAGGIGPEVRIGSAIDPAIVRNLDTGEDLRPTRLSAGEGRGVLVSSDRFLDPREAQSLASSGVVAVDMETAAIGSVCVRMGLAWSVCRAISDRADDGSTDPAVLDLVDEDGRPRPAAVARFLLTRPHRIPQLVRLARGTQAATHRAANAALAALDALA